MDPTPLRLPQWPPGAASDASWDGFGRDEPFGRAGVGGEEWYEAFSRAVGDHGSPGLENECFLEGQAAPGWGITRGSGEGELKRAGTRWGALAETSKIDIGGELETRACCRAGAGGPGRGGLKRAGTRWGGLGRAQPGWGGLGRAEREMWTPPPLRLPHGTMVKMESLPFGHAPKHTPFSPTGTLGSADYTVWRRALLPKNAFGKKPQNLISRLVAVNSP